MVRCCLATLHRLGHPGRQGNHETWDSGPIPVGEGIGKRRRRRHAWEIAHQPWRTTGTGLTISLLARPMCDITARKWIIEKRSYSVEQTKEQGRSWRQAAMLKTERNEFECAQSITGRWHHWQRISNHRKWMKWSNEKKRKWHHRKQEMSPFFWENTELFITVP